MKNETRAYIVALLRGVIPVTREELFELVNTWGRKEEFVPYTEHLHGSKHQIIIEKDISTDCYDLSNLDVSYIWDMSEIFRGSLYNGDLSKWDMSRVVRIDKMFQNSDFNNDSIKDWNVVKVENSIDCFLDSKFSYVEDLNWNLKSLIHNKQSDLFEPKQILENIENKLKENELTLNNFLNENKIDSNSEQGLKLIEQFNKNQSILNERKDKISSFIEIDTESISNSTLENR